MIDSFDHESFPHEVKIKLEKSIVGRIILSKGIEQAKKLLSLQFKQITTQISINRESNHISASVRIGNNDFELLSISKTDRCRLDLINQLTKLEKVIKTFNMIKHNERQKALAE